MRVLKHILLQQSLLFTLVSWQTTALQLDIFNERKRRINENDVAS